MPTKTVTSRLFKQRVNSLTKGTTTTDSYLYTYTRTRTGVPNPRWRQQIKDGINASTSFTGSEQTVKAVDGTGQISFIWPSLTDPNRYVREAKTQNEAMSVIAWQPVFPDFASADNQALTRAFKAIREAQYQISGPTFIGEFRQSLEMLKRPFRSMADYSRGFLSTLNKRKAYNRRRLDRVLADTWLEFSFGWSPFMSDIKSAAETLARFETDIRRTQIKAFGESSSLNSQSLSNGYTNATVPFIAQSRVMSINKVIYRVGLDARANFDKGSTRRLIELSGFQFQNFIPTAWELLPWSFMIDYFSNVGNVIEAGCTDLSSVTRVTKNLVAEKRFDYNARINTAQAVIDHGIRLVDISGSSLGSWTTFSRQTSRVASALNYPSLRFELPGSPGQLGNIAALIVSGRRMQPYNR